MRFFLFLQKHFGRVFLSAACLLLQGCNNWFSSKSPEVVTNENSTVVGTSENEAVTEVEEPAKPVRATPRRPVVVEEPVFEPIPVEEPTFSPVIPDESTTYVVRKGDTLTKIAHRFHVSVLQLMQENQLKNKNKLSVGQVLAIPQGGSSAGSSPSGEVEPYRVVKGDTLSKIAKRFQISLFELQQMNGFDRNTTLMVDQMILVPKSASMPSSSANKDGIYSVQKGDTLGKIAKKFGTTVAKLREQNRLKSDTIYVGQELYLSGTAPVKKKKSSPSKSDAASIEGDTYTVQAGDNLWGIAKRCRRSVAELTRLNDLQNPEQLQVGQVLRLKERSSVFSEKPSRHRETSVKRYDEVPVKRHDDDPFVRDDRPSEPVMPLHTKPVDEPKPSPRFEEDDFKDLFEENKDMPVVPLDVQ